MLTVISDRTLEIDYELCTCSIDWQKAFCLVKWAKLMQILTKLVWAGTED
jgi:hypothetical protein